MSIRLEHVALWTCDLERQRAFYLRYFGARYDNAARPYPSSPAGGSPKTSSAAVASCIDVLTAMPS